MNNKENLLNSPIADIKRGFIQECDKYICLICGKTTEKGVIYQAEGIFYEAEKFMKSHIQSEHGSVFDYLIEQDKKMTGLSDHQNNLLRLFYQGKSDTEVQEALGIGSSSTIRNHRFVLKEKEHQAKLFIAMMELLRENGKKESQYVTPHKSAKMVDDRYKVTVDENTKILKKYFTKGLQGPIPTFQMKEKSKLIVLRQISKRFESGKIYCENEVNEILKTANEDFVTLRRYLIEYGFMDRKADGSQYWLKEMFDKSEEENMDRKKEMLLQYKEIKKEAGIYQIRNTVNNKVLIISTPELKSTNGRRFELNNGSYRNKQLQEDWNKYGEEAFTFEVLEVLDEEKESLFDMKDELKKLEIKWLNKLQPFGGKGYHEAMKNK